MEEKSEPETATSPLTKSRPFLFVGTVLLLTMILALFPGTYAEYKADELKPKDQLITAQTIERAGSTVASVGDTNAFQKSLNAAFPFDEVWNPKEDQHSNGKPDAGKMDVGLIHAEQSLLRPIQWPTDKGPVPFDSELRAKISKFGAEVDKAAGPKAVFGLLHAQVTCLIRLTSDQGIFVPANMEQYGIKATDCDDLSQLLSEYRKRRSLGKKIQILRAMSALLVKESAEYGAREPSGDLTLSRAQSATLTKGGEADDKDAIAIKLRAHNIESARNPQELDQLIKDQRSDILKVLGTGLRHSIVPSAALVLTGAWLAGVLLALAVDKRKERSLPPQKGGKIGLDWPRWAAILVALVGVGLLLAPAVAPGLIAQAIFGLTALGNLLSSHKMQPEDWLAIAKTPTPAFLPFAIASSLFFYYASGKIMADPTSEGQSKESQPPAEGTEARPAKDSRDRAWEFLIPDAASAVAAGGLLLSGAVMAPALISSASPKPSTAPAVAVPSDGQRGTNDRSQTLQEREKDKEWAALIAGLNKSLLQTANASLQAANASSQLQDSVDAQDSDHYLTQIYANSANKSLVKGVDALRKAMDTSWQNGQKSYQSLNDTLISAAKVTNDSASPSTPSNAVVPRATDSDKSFDKLGSDFRDDKEEASAMGKCDAQNQKDALKNAVDAGVISEHDYLIRLDTLNIQEQFQKNQSKTALKAATALAEERASNEVLKVVRGTYQHLAGKMIEPPNPEKPKADSKAKKGAGAKG